MDLLINQTETALFGIVSFVISHVIQLAMFLSIKTDEGSNVELKIIFISDMIFVAIHSLIVFVKLKLYKKKVNVVVAKLYSTYLNLWKIMIYFTWTDLDPIILTLLIVPAVEFSVSHVRYNLKEDESFFQSKTLYVVVSLVILLYPSLAIFPIFQGNAVVIAIYLSMIVLLYLNYAFHADGIIIFYLCFQLLLQSFIIVSDWKATDDEDTITEEKTVTKKERQENAGDVEVEDKV